MPEKTRRRRRSARAALARSLGGLTALLIVGLAGCGEDREARILREIEQAQAARQTPAPVPTSERSPKSSERKAPTGFTCAVTDGVRLALGMSLAEAQALLPRRSEDPEDIVQGVYRLTLRNLGGRTVSMTFVEERLAMMVVRGRYSREQASDYRATLEREYGEPEVQGNRLIWEREEPDQSVVAVFHAGGGGYDVETTLIDAAATADIRTDTPFPAPP